ncbi:HNH endonuclease signature motif containing protein [Mobilicoccus massiliensis]|uniref:HNH endonuclease signature motif containing protein n=1 Tax=Mobilicoccus massiliensis TaxID=1522310 RepID=UPI001144FB7F|nr:HNH endonuclease signature motif containing protein [Mobilicoccus massiliensis]
MLLRVTQEAPAEAVAGIVGRVTAPYPMRGPDGRGGLLVPQEVFTSRLRYAMARVTTPVERVEQGLANRCTSAVLTVENGMGEFTVSGHAARVIGAHERVDEIARRLRREGDARTLAQLRSDIALDLMLFGQLPAQAGQWDPHTGKTGVGAELAAQSAALASGAVESGIFGAGRMALYANGARAGRLGGGAAGMSAEVGGDGAADCAVGDRGPGPFAAYATFSGALPPARVDVVVSLAALMGASEEPGSAACGGRQEWVAARFVREVAFTAGSTWRRLVTDPVTGHLVDLHVKGYQVAGDLRERVLARDRVSRVPGSMRPARSCDLDHDVAYALGGASSESNLSAKDRRGHNHKTRRTWRVRREPVVGGDIFWTTPAGRVYVTSPWDYRDPDPPTVEQMRANLARERRRYWTEEDLLAEEDTGDPRRSGPPSSQTWPPGSAWAGIAVGGAVDSRSFDATCDAPAEQDENSSDRSEVRPAPTHPIHAALPDGDAIDPADWGEDAWVLHDLDLNDIPARQAGESTADDSSKDAPQPAEGVSLDSEYERGLAALIEDAQDPQSLFIRPPKPARRPKPEPRRWERRDPGPPPF